ncbi:MAG TPA: ATP-binding protein [Burkholderiaceae bacterium]|nr:ATP-binding protein [Burkholderiaceae bacterium]
MTHPPLDDVNAFLAGGGEMGALMRAMDWASTPFGPPASWPQSLKTAVSICLNSRFPIPLWWGPELRLIYNDAWRPVLGRTKHPRALGSPGHEVWPEIWHIIGPKLQGVLEHGQATWSDDELLMLDRNGYLEEAYFTYSYSPIRDEDGRVIAVFSAVNETTERVIGERQMALLRELAAQTVDVRTYEQACIRSARALETDALDIPFALIYLQDDRAADRFTLVCHCGLPDSHPALRTVLHLDDGLWPVAAAMQTHSPVTLRLPAVGAPWPTGAWTHPPQQATIVPIAPSGAQGRGGVLIAGLSPHRLFDDNYRRFVELIGGQIAAAIGNAQAYEEERRRAEALAELDRAKTLFFSNVSHELRTPLTLMLGPLDELLRDPRLAQDPEQADRLTMMRRNGQRLLRLVNTLLDFARIEAGRMQAAYEPVDLAAETADLASVFRSAIEKAGMELEVRCEPLPGPVYVDRSMWEKIVLNLLSNAFKYTLRGRITVELVREGEAVALRVHDTGVGIPPEHLPHLFDRFHRVEGSQGRTHEGTGIGLALVRELVQLHAGTVGVASTPGVGTCFEVRLPLGSSHLPADRVHEQGRGGAVDTYARSLVDEAMQFVSTRPGDLVPLTDAPAAAIDAEGEQATILLAEDNADMREYVRRLLAPRHRVVTAAHGGEALDLARRLRPDLVLTDVMMPVLDGFALVERLRRDPVTATIPIVMLSARAGEEAKIEGLQAGADDYLVKPFSARELLGCVQARLELSRVRRELDQRISDILESITDGLVTFDREWRYRYVNREAERLLGRPRGELLGRCVWELYPQALGTEIERKLRETAERGVTTEFEGHNPVLGSWYDHKAYANPDGGVTVFFRDATARHLAQQALAESERRKDEFLATLAHELRNPLAPLRTGLEILRIARDRPETAAQALQLMERQLGHMVRLIDELMDLSRISRGLIELKMDQVPLADVVHHAVETSRPLLDARQHELVIELPGQPLVVRADAMRLGQVLCNLLNNAAKYTEPGGRIRLAVERRGEEVCIAVSDNGIGIPPQMLPRVFDMFSQVHRSFDATGGGLGIGLAIVKRLVEMHGGRVQAHSDGPSRGSTFTVCLPLPPQAAADQGTAAERAPAADAAARRVLVCDDNRDAVESLAVLLELLGHEVRACGDGMQAVEAFEAWRPQVILMDIGMPGLDGYGACRKIRERPGGDDVFIVALTGWGQPEDRERGRQAGFDAHLLKPIEPAALQAVLDACDERRSGSA